MSPGGGSPGGGGSGVGRHTSAPKGSTLQLSARAAPGSNRARANNAAPAIGIETMLRNRSCGIGINSHPIKKF
ncbi:MAG TPA: hypothetical protein DEO90_06780 [Synechococcales bacterium UBA8647]|nr:hypothetical protein [Synechococcales bacterium UBA8647]